MQTAILAWEFVTRRCLKPQNPCSNHEIHVLFEHGFYLKKPYWALICMHDVTLICVAALTGHFADAFVRENVTRVYMTLWWRNDVRKLTKTPFSFEKSSVRKGIFDVLAAFSARFMLKSVKICKNNNHTCLFHCINTSGSLGRCLNT